VIVFIAGSGLKRSSTVSDGSHWNRHLGLRSGSIFLGLTGLPETHHNAQHDDRIPRRTPTPLRSPRGASLRPTTVTLELPDVTTRPQSSAAFYFAGLIQSED